MCMKKGKGIEMAKKNETPVVDIDIDAIDIQEETDVIGDIIVEAESVIEEVKEESAQAETKEEKAGKAKEIIDKIKQQTPEYAGLPDSVTPKMLDVIFALGDGGRTIRRYLRKYFAEQHIHKEGWNLTKKEACTVIGFLSTRYGEPHFDKLNEKSEEEGKA